MINECKNAKQLTPKSINDLKTLAKWTYFLGLASICLGVIIAILILIRFLGGNVSIGMLSNIISCAIYFVLGNCLKNAGVNIADAVDRGHEESLEDGFKNLKVFFIITAVLILLELVIGIIKYIL